jgi:hypothetical protein
MDEGLKDENIEKVTKAINGGLTNIDEKKLYKLDKRIFQIRH